MIKKDAIKKIAVYFTLLIMPNTLLAQMVSPFNKRCITDSSKNYSFIVSAHFHGASTNVSTYPASSLLANIDTLNSLNPSFLMSLGDMFLDVNQTYIDHYQNSFFNKLQIPLLNAVGNHDLSNNNKYEKVYGKTFFAFKKSTEMFIVLNTELNDGSIKGEQLEMLKSFLNKAKEPAIKNVFIFSHRPVWAEVNPKYTNLFQGNTRSRFGSPNFEKEIRPLLEALSKPIYWISGSMGGGGSASFFYDKDDHHSIIFMQTAIRDLPKDAVLQVNSTNGKISFNGISLTGNAIEPIENYNIEYWNKSVPVKEKFNYRLIPLFTIQLLTHHFFWIGFVSCGIIISLLRFVIKQWKKRK